VKNCTLKPYFYIFVEHFLYMDVTTSLQCTCTRIFQTSVRKPRNQRKHQQVYVNFLSRGQLCCVDGLKSEDAFGHDITPLTRSTINAPMLQSDVRTLCSCRACGGQINFSFHQLKATMLLASFEVSSTLCHK